MADRQNQQPGRDQQRGGNQNQPRRDQKGGQQTGRDSGREDRR